MPKQYTRKYSLKWESETWAKGQLLLVTHYLLSQIIFVLGWLTKASNNHLQEAYCKVCHVALRAHQTDLKKHASCKQHLKNVGLLINNNNKITNHMIVTGHEQKIRDIKVAYYIAMHTSIKCVDHLSEMITNIAQEFKKDFKMQLHRTKSSHLIKKVIAPTLLNELVLNVKNVKFSIIVDESTDISVVKYLCICVRYFSKKSNNIITDFLGILVVETATAQSL